MEPCYTQIRRELMDLIDSKPYFKRRELIEEFRGMRAGKSMNIGGAMTIAEFIEGFRDVGRLTYDSGLYVNPNYKPAPCVQNR